MTCTCGHPGSGCSCYPTYENTLHDPTRGLIDKPCADCGSTVFYVGAMTLLCTLCLDRQARMREDHVDGPMTPITTEEEA